jgi:hypothetical protein
MRREVLSDEGSPAKRAIKDELATITGEQSSGLAANRGGCDLI